MGCLLCPRVTLPSHLMARSGSRPEKATQGLPPMLDRVSIDLPTHRQVLSVWPTVLGELNSKAHSSTNLSSTILAMYMRRPHVGYGSTSQIRRLVHGRAFSILCPTPLTRHSNRLITTSATMSKSSLALTDNW